MTAAEFDYSLARSMSGYDCAALAALGQAAQHLVREGLPVITPQSPAAELMRRHEAGVALVKHFGPEIDAMVEAAKARSYTGWSTGGPIRYAD